MRVRLKKQTVARVVAHYSISGFYHQCIEKPVMIICLFFVLKMLPKLILENR